MNLLGKEFCEIFLHDKKISKKEKKNFVRANMDGIANYIISLEEYKHEDLPQINQAMLDETFTNNYLDLMKSKAHVRAYNFMFNVFFFSKNICKEEQKSKLLDYYIRANRNYIRTIASSLSCTSSEATTISILVPKLYENENIRNIRMRVYRFTSHIYKVYGISNIDNNGFTIPICRSTLAKFIDNIFYDYENEFMMYVLLEFKNKISTFDQLQISMFNVFTDFVINWLEVQPKKNLRKFLTEYAEHKQNDSLIEERRIELLNHLVREDYPNLISTAIEISEEYPMVDL